MPKRIIFLAKLLFVSTLFHVLVIIVLWLFCRQTYEIITLVIHDKQPPIQMMFQVPAIKNIPQITQQTNISSPAVASKQPIKNASPEPKKAQGTTMTAEKKADPVVKKPQISAEKNALKKPVIEKPKPIEQKKDSLPFAKKDEKKQIINPVKPVVENVVTNSFVVPDSVQTKTDEIMEITKTQPMGDKSAWFSMLGHTIKERWRPPLGLSADLECALKIIINYQGIVQEVKVEKSSSVITYDIAARRAIKEISFPRQLYGKELIITFKQ